MAGAQRRGQDQAAASLAMAHQLTQAQRNCARWLADRSRPDSAALGRFFIDLPEPIDHAMVTQRQPVLRSQPEMDFSQAHQMVNENVGHHRFRPAQWSSDVSALTQSCQRRNTSAREAAPGRLLGPYTDATDPQDGGP
jgi:hypothetical protein